MMPKQHNPQRKIDLLTEDTYRQLMHHAICIGRFTNSGRAEDVVLVGSGTLVSIGSIKGILTVAHVLDALPNNSEIDLIRFNKPAERVEQLLVRMCETDSVRIAPKSYGEAGPDLAFLKLPETVLGQISATNSFYSINHPRSDGVKSISKSQPTFGVVVGGVDEWTRDRIVQQGHARDFECIAGTGLIEDRPSLDGFDYREIEITFEVDEKQPKSFQGVSGGGLWEIPYTVRDNRVQIGECQLQGVAFFEIPNEDKPPKIVCHGPHSIYTKLTRSIGTQKPDWL